MPEYSEQDLKYATEFREEIHREALAIVHKTHPNATKVIDRHPVEDYFQENWEYPGKLYTIVSIPYGYKSRQALVDTIVRNTLSESFPEKDKPYPQDTTKANKPENKPDGYAGLFAEYPPRRIEISIYGATERTYEAVTRVQGSYERFIHGLDLLLQHRERVPIVLKSVLMQENVAERFAVQKIAIDRGLALAQNSLIRPRLDGKAGPEEHRLTPEIVAGTEMEIKSEFDAWDEFAVVTTPISRQTEIVDCSAGNVAFQIDPLGRLGYCVIARVPEINLLETPMSDAWKILGSKREHYFKKPQKCLSCQDAKFCDFCPGYLSIGNKLADSSDGDQSYHCAVARDRHKKYLARQNDERRKI